MYVKTTPYVLSLSWPTLTSRPANMYNQRWISRRILRSMERFCRTSTQCLSQYNRKCLTLKPSDEHRSYLLHCLTMSTSYALLQTKPSNNYYCLICWSHFKTLPVGECMRLAFSVSLRQDTADRGDRLVLRRQELNRTEHITANNYGCFHHSLNLFWFMSVHSLNPGSYFIKDSKLFLQPQENIWSFDWHIRLFIINDDQSINIHDRDLLKQSHVWRFHNFFNFNSTPQCVRLFNKTKQTFIIINQHVKLTVRLTWFLAN